MLVVPPGPLGRRRPTPLWQRCPATRSLALRDSRGRPRRDAQGLPGLARRPVAPEGLESRVTAAVRPQAALANVLLAEAPQGHLAAQMSTEVREAVLGLRQLSVGPGKCRNSPRAQCGQMLLECTTSDDLQKNDITDPQFRVHAGDAHQLRVDIPPVPQLGRLLGDHGSNLRLQLRIDGVVRAEAPEQLTQLGKFEAVQPPEGLLSQCRHQASQLAVTRRHGAEGGHKVHEGARGHTGRLLCEYIYLCCKRTPEARHRVPEVDPSQDKV
mmetsp:Transcript_78325/g.253704  ORF Transcript_78325/g.253704 Transcript_78325/m.253704 type:complete len:269 (+) Transcript_78325:182-988(+)